MQGVVILNSFPTNIRYQLQAQVSLVKVCLRNKNVNEGLRDTHTVKLEVG